jgi:hypothetical protein
MIVRSAMTKAIYRRPQLGREINIFQRGAADCLSGSFGPTQKVEKLQAPGSSPAIYAHAYLSKKGQPV